jgi:hypothetical protein
MADYGGLKVCGSLVRLISLHVEMVCLLCDQFPFPISSECGITAIVRARDGWV